MVFCCMAIRLSLRLTAFHKASTIFICARNFSSRPSKYFCIDAQPAASPPEKSACSDTLFLSVGRYFVDNPRPTTGKISACSRRYKEREELQVHAPTAKRLQQSRFKFVIWSPIVVGDATPARNHEGDAGPAKNSIHGHLCKSPQSNSYWEKSNTSGGTLQIDTMLFSI